MVIMKNFDKYNCLYFGSSCKQATIFFHLIALLFMSNFTSVLSDSQPPHMCNDDGTYTDGSTLISNFNRVMGDLVSNTPQTGFNTSSYGETPNRIYGFLQCAGDISEQQCSTCSQEANKSVRQLCPLKKGGRVLLGSCYLRYENFSFSEPSNNVDQLLVNSSNISSGDINSFRTTTSTLLSKLSDEARNFANKGFAQGSATYSVNGTVYGEVQCWRDLPITNCTPCLQTAIKNVSDDYSMRRGALLGSCLVRYDTYPFIDNTSASPPPTSAPSGINPPTFGAPLANGTSSTMTSNISPLHSAL